MAPETRKVDAGATPAGIDRWVDTAHGRLFVRCWQPPGDDGTLPIVLFHDSLGCVGVWRNFPAVLAAQTGRMVIAYDRLGFGASDARTDTLGLDFIRAEAEIFFPALREQIGFARCILFGHSVGGGMAVHCAALHPETCAALITESAQAFVEDRTRAGIEAARAAFRQPEALARLERYHGARTRWVLNAWIDTWLAPGFAGWSLDAVLPQVTCPTLVLHGSEDEYGSPEHPRRIAQGVRGPAQLELLPDTFHVPHREREAQVAGRIAAFIAAAMP